jgi:hypothetical protein
MAVMNISKGWKLLVRSTGQCMDTMESFLLGIMMAWTPSLLFVALLLGTRPSFEE